MFDASEIRFLDCAVQLNLLTPNQRGRLMGYQSSMPQGMKITSLVTEAGLMVDDEVAQVLAAIARGIGASPTAFPGSSAFSAPSETAQTPSAYGAATSQILDEVLGDVEREENEAVAHELAMAVRTVLHDGARPHSPDDDSASANREAANMYQAERSSSGFEPPRPMFPIPGMNGTNGFSAAPVPTEASGMTGSSFPASADPMAVGQPSNGLATGTDSPLARFAALTSEIDDLIAAEEPQAGAK